MKKNEIYEGFELGPIRPPSEAHSLLLRITRNCPWNKCKFCGLYKGKRFSIRPVSHIKQDIDRVRNHIDKIHAVVQKSPVGKNPNISALLAETPGQSRWCFRWPTIGSEGG